MEGGSANDYEYCNADPINCSDLSGQASKWRTIRTVDTRVDNHGVFGNIYAAVRVQRASGGRLRVQFEIRTKGPIRKVTYFMRAWIQGPDGKIRHDRDFTFATGQGVVHPSAPYVAGGRYRVSGYAIYDAGRRGLTTVRFWGDVVV